MDSLANILVVDNEDRICELIKITLEELPDIGSIVVANNSVAALQKLQNQSFDLLIIDLVMKGKTGLELVDIIKKSPRHSQLKVILISGCLTKQHVHEAVRLGVKNILVKPFNRAKLIEQVKSALNITSSL